MATVTRWHSRVSILKAKFLHLQPNAFFYIFKPSRTLNPSSPSEFSLPSISHCNHWIMNSHYGASSGSSSQTLLDINVAACRFVPENNLPFNFRSVVSCSGDGCCLRARNRTLFNFPLLLISRALSFRTEIFAESSLTTLLVPTPLPTIFDNLNTTWKSTETFPLEQQ